MTPDFAQSPPAQRHMARIRANNRWFWRQCVRDRRGFDSTPFRLRGNFGTETADQHERLESALRDRGYEVVTIGERNSLTETVFETPAQIWTLEQWNAWTDDMTALGFGIELALFGGITEAVVDEDVTASLERARAEHRARNPATWRALRSQGVTETTAIALDAHFWARDEVSASRLRHGLEVGLGYSAAVEPPARGLLRGRRPWSVTGTRPPQTTNELELGEWTDRMVEIAERTGTRFDGWGTWVAN